MGNLSKNFDRSEFECHGENCCDHSAPISDDLIYGLQELRDKIDAPIHVNCGFRCNRHNKKISHAENSMHTLGLAADIWSPAKTSRALADMAETIGVFQRGGIGIYKNFIHVDVRKTGKGRWHDDIS